MVKELFMCEECNFLYSSKERAQDCENFCKEHKQCSLEITKDSVGMEKKHT